MTLPKNRALLYQRLSGVEDDEISPDIQLKRALQVANEHGLEVNLATDIYADTDKGMHSARKRTNIPQWDKMIVRATTDPTVAAIITYDLRRIFRNVRAMLDEAELLAKHGVKILFYRGSIKTIDLTTADGRKAAIDDANAAEYESHKTSERLTDHYAELRERNIYFSHQAPFGLSRSGTRAKVVWTPNPQEFPILLVTLELYASGWFSPSRLALEIQQRGLLWRCKDKPTACKTSMLRQLLDHVERYKGFIPDELLAEVVREREARRAGPPQRRRKHPPSLLSGVLKCAVCGASFHAANKRSPFYSGYRHRPDVPCDARPLIPRTADIDTQFLTELETRREYILRHKEQIIAAQISAPEPVAQSDNRMLRQRLDKLLRGYEEMRALGEISREDFADRKQDIQQQLALLVALPVVETPVVTEAEARAWWELMETQLSIAANNIIVRRYVNAVYLHGRELVKIDWKFGEVE